MDHARMDSVFKHQHLDGRQSSWHKAGRFWACRAIGTGEASVTRGTDRPTDYLKSPPRGGQVGLESLRPPEFSAGPKS